MSFGGFSFGGQSQQPQQGSQPGFGFGQSSATAPKPSLFGNTGSNTSSSFGFGNQQSSQQQQPQQSTTGFSFGSTNPLGNSQQPSSNPSAGLGFGNTQQQPQSQPQQPQSSTFGFGNTQSQQQPSTSFGLQTSLSQQPQQPNQQSQSAFNKSTKFNDLSDAHKKIIEDIDGYIQGRSHISLNLKAEEGLGKDVTKSSNLLIQVQNNLMSLKSTLTHTDASLQSLKGDTDTDTVRALIMTRVIDGYKRPQEFGAYLKTYRDFPHEYFSQISEDLLSRSLKYTHTLEQIERHLSYLLSTNSSMQSLYTPQAISQILQTQHSTFMSLASSVANLNAEVNELKDGYREIWRMKTKSIADPFNV